MLPRPRRRYDAGMSDRPVNWAGNIEFHAVRVEHPRSLDELGSLVASNQRVRALGTGHSFNDIADTTGIMIRLDQWQTSMISGDGSITVAAGQRYTDIVGELHERGLALANLASLPHITLGGAVATGTHGSGDALRNLSAAVVGLRLVTGRGEALWLAQESPDFAGAVVSLGALGIVTELALRVEPGFEVAQQVRLAVPLDEIGASWDEVFGAAYSVSAFTSYVDGLANVWLKRRTDGRGSRSDWLGGRTAEQPIHPIPSVDPAACTPQLGEPGAWHERLPHFRADHVPSVGNELQSEFFVDRAEAPAALDALRGIAHIVGPVLHISELRTIRGDELWLSPAYGRDSVGFHFTWIRDVAAVLPVVAEVEKALLPLGARPHWGKVCTVDTAEIRARYPRAADFTALVRRLDPEGKFANRYTTTLFG
jgi:xylitol oxidase